MTDIRSVPQGRILKKVQGAYELGLKKLPTIASLRADYAPILDEKKKAYREYRQAKAEMRELLTAKTNVDRLLNITDTRPSLTTERDI